MIRFAEAFQNYVGLAVPPERERFQRRCAMLIDRWIRILRRVELINDIDRLRSHAHLRHERIERHHLFLLQTSLRNQVVKLHSEHDLAFGAQLCAQFLRHHSEVLLLVKRLPKQLSQLGVNRLWIIVAKETQARVDLLLHYHAVCFRETRQDLDQQRQQVRPLRNAARLPQCPAHPATTSPPHTIRKGGHPLHSAIDLICHG